MEKGKYNILNFILYKEIKMLKEKLLNDLKVAMKEKNVNKKNAVQMVRTAILQIEKDKDIEVSDEQIINIIAKEVKIH